MPVTLTNSTQIQNINTNTNKKQIQIQIQHKYKIKIQILCLQQHNGQVLFEHHLLSTLIFIVYKLSSPVSESELQAVHGH